MIFLFVSVIKWVISRETYNLIILQSFREKTVITLCLVEAFRDELGTNDPNDENTILTPCS